MVASYQWQMQTLLKRRRWGGGDLGGTTIPYLPLLHLLQMSEVNKIQLWHGVVILCGFVDS